MVSTAAAVVIAIVVLVLVAAIGWAAFTQLRARRLGLPPPTLSSYFPWSKSSSPYGPPQPAPGGVVGWFNDQVRKFKNRNNRSAAGAYEQPLQSGAGARGNRGFGPLDPDEAWDARVGHEADGYGYHEEQELSRGGGTEYQGSGGYTARLGGNSTMVTDYDDVERGRQPHRVTDAAAAGRKNPFDDDGEVSLRGISPRPVTASASAGYKPTTTERPGSAGSSLGERRSVFRENMS